MQRIAVLGTILTLLVLAFATVGPPASRHALHAQGTGFLALPIVGKMPPPPPPPPPLPGLTTRVSVAPDGAQADQVSIAGNLSTDERYIVVDSLASNLVANDTNGVKDVFVKDLQTGAVTRVSVASDGTQSNDWSESGRISGDGRYVTFVSAATNLVAGDTNGMRDIFVHDLQTHLTTRVSVSSAGQQANDYSTQPAISADGRYVAFVSRATNLVPFTPHIQHIFRHDRATGETIAVSVDQSGSILSTSSFHPDISDDGRYVTFSSWGSYVAPGGTALDYNVFLRDIETSTNYLVSKALTGNADDESDRPFISSDGRYVIFMSHATNLVNGDTNQYADCFVYDHQTQSVSRISVSSGGVQGNRDSYTGTISDDGRYVAFISDASTLVDYDTMSDQRDVFVHDRLSGQTEMISRAPDGTLANGPAGFRAFISQSGRYVSYWSAASNIVTNDTNGADDAFIYDRTPSTE